MDDRVNGWSFHFVLALMSLEVVLLVRLLVGTVLGAAIGYERQLHGRAGVRRVRIEPLS